VAACACCVEAGVLASLASGSLPSCQELLGLSKSAHLEGRGFQQLQPASGPEIASRDCRLPSACRQWSLTAALCRAPDPRCSCATSSCPIIPQPRFQQFLRVLLAPALLLQYHHPPRLPNLGDCTHSTASRAAQPDAPT